MAKTASLNHLGITAYLWRRKRPDGSRYPHWSGKWEIEGKLYERSTKERTLERAQERVRDFIAELMTGIPKGRPLTPSSWASLSDVLLAYSSGTVHALPSTIRTNKNALLQIVATRHPSTCSTLCLTADLVEEWMRLKQGKKNLDRRTRTQQNISINSTYRHARDVFASKLMQSKYQHLKLPDLTGFLNVALLPVPSQFWTRIPRANYQAMLSAAAKLRATNPDLWLCNLLLRRLGLRNSELAAATRDWIIEHGLGHALQVQDRPGWQLKGARPRLLPLSPDIAEILLSRQPGEHLLLPNATKTDRLELIERTHNQWLREFIPDRVKGNHELRKHAGSLILTQHGLAAAQRFLGHCSQSTTERWYATYLGDLPVLTLDDEEGF